MLRRDAAARQAQAWRGRLASGEVASLEKTGIGFVSVLEASVYATPARVRGPRSALMLLAGHAQSASGAQCMSLPRLPPFRGLAGVQQGCAPPQGRRRMTPVQMQNQL